MTVFDSHPPTPLGEGNLNDIGLSMFYGFERNLMGLFLQSAIIIVSFLVVRSWYVINFLFWFSH